MARRIDANKHTTYYELLDACKKGGCPICTMALDTVARYLESVLYENVNDPATRDALVRARGYCNDHSWQLREMYAGLGTAIIYRDVLRHVAEAIERSRAGGTLDVFGNGPGGLRGRLAALTGGGKLSGRKRSATDPHRACPACRVRSRYELIYLGALVEHLEDSALMEALHGAGGICLVHLDRAATAVRDRAAFQRLLQVQHACMVSLHEELGEFIRKHDYRFQGEGMGAEGNSWVRAIELVAGKRGIR